MPCMVLPPSRAPHICFRPITACSALTCRRCPSIYLTILLRQAPYLPTSRHVRAILDTRRRLANLCGLMIPPIPQRRTPQRPKRRPRHTITRSSRPYWVLQQGPSPVTQLRGRPSRRCHSPALAHLGLAMHRHQPRRPPHREDPPPVPTRRTSWTFSTGRARAPRLAPPIPPLRRGRQPPIRYWLRCLENE